MHSAVSSDGDAWPWAHSANGSGSWHRLDEHLRGTGELAAAFAQPFGGASLARWLGRSHDLGKATCAWQDALARVAGSDAATGVPHKQHAARLAREVGGHASGVQAPIAASALLGHHSGIPDLVSGIAGQMTTMDVLRTASLDSEIAEAVSWLRRGGFGDLVSEARSVQLPDWLPLNASPTDAPGLRRLEMFTRMVFSALVDADYLDTQAHFDGTSVPYQVPVADFVALQDEFEETRAEMLAGRSGSPVDGVREAVYSEVTSQADLPPGIFYLPAPTGSGKTLTVAGFALKHAAANGLRRVVVAVPFTSITTQNAAVYRGALDRPGRQRVLEHHSAVLDGEYGSSRWRRLAAQNWDAPFIVTTTVQLFQSLMSNRPSKARRLHRLAGSVIVLDEVQALPMHLLPVLLDLLRTLVDDYGASVVLSTATQPAFWALPVWSDLPVQSLLPAEAEVRSALKRVSYEWRLDPPAAWDTVANWAGAERQALVVVNTTADAQQLHQRLQESAPAGTAVLHLSTRMCGEHRRHVLDHVRRLLREAQPVLLVSTQVIEAGVDVDFPVVYRALAPVDSIAQAAGRANREGRLSSGGRVIIFDPATGGLPGSDYRTATSLTRQRFAEPRADPDDPDTLDNYYRSLYAHLLPGGSSVLSDSLQTARAEMAFRTVADQFRMIDDSGIPTIVDYDDAVGRAGDLAARLQHGEQLSSTDWRFLQTRTATLPRRTAEQCVAAGLAVSVGGSGDAGHMFTPPLLWLGDYDALRGLDPAAPTTAEEVIW